jgi:hypothetical protein
MPKAQAPSAAVWATGRKDSAPAACATILERAVRAPDPFFSVRDGWIVRRLSPDCSRIELDQIAEERDEWRLLRAMGWETANLHLGTRDARIASDLKRRPNSWLDRATRIMARATEADWAHGADEVENLRLRSCRSMSQVKPGLSPLKGRN